MAQILCTFKDTGDMKNIWPVAFALFASYGHKVTLMGSSEGVGYTQINSEKNFDMPFMVAKDARQYQEYGYNLPDLLVTGMASNEDHLGRELVPICKRAGIPTVAIQDYWGAQLWTSWADRQYHPDYIFVNDDIGKKLVIDAWPEYRKDHIIIASYPALDALVRIDQPSTRNKINRELNLNPNWPLLVFCGETDGTVETLQKTVQILNSVEMDNFYFTARPHPKMGKERPDLLSSWDQALKTLKKGKLVESSNQSTTDMLCAANAAVAMYSTTLVEKAALGGGVISVMYPEIGEKVFKSRFAGQLEEFPLNTLGCSRKVSNNIQFKEAIQDALCGKLEGDLDDAQLEVFKLKGRNAITAASVINDIFHTPDEDDEEDGFA